MTAGRQRLIAVLAFAVIVILGWFAYAPAQGGIFLLDDVFNLQGLRLVDDATSAMNFVFSGTAGPLGRPLALATFVPQAAAWGQDAAPFLKVNILIHLGNACILAFVIYYLSILSNLERRAALVAAVAAAAIWLFMPLLASSSLMVVQRMTTLSGSFSLLSIAAYLLARRSIERTPLRALTGMSVALVTGTTLAAFSKENGVLLPTLILVVESTLLSRPSSVKPGHWRAWAGAFLWLPTLAILAYLLMRVPYSEELVLRRDFTGWERFLTQSRILWEYLFNAFVPQPGRFGPFHDGYTVARTLWNPLTFLAVAGWLVTVTLAILWRRRYPLFSFATLWYIGGHMLESTLVPLELYFEHRNYLPIIGPIYALCALAVAAQAPHRRLLYGGLCAYIAVFAVMLFSQASLWGNPQMAALLWKDRFPGSVRAATTAAMQQLAEHGPQSALQTIRRISDEMPNAGYLKIQELNISCIIQPGEDHRETVVELDRLLPSVDFTYTAGTMFSDLITTVTRVGCNGVDESTVRDLAARLASNPRYANDAAYRQLHEQLLARLSRHEGDFEQTVRHLQKAILYKPSSELNMMMVTTLADANDYGGARAYIESARKDLPTQPFRKIAWNNELDELARYIDEREQFASDRP